MARHRRSSARPRPGAGTADSDRFARDDGATTPPDRRPAAPSGLRDLDGAGWWATAKRAVREFQDDHMLDSAAALTYFGILALFPALLVFVSLIGLFGSHPETTNALLAIVGELGPQSVVETVRGTIQGVVENQGGAGALFGVSLLGALWSASGYLGAFFRASNRIYEVEEGRSFFKLRPLQIALTAVLLVVVAFGAIAFLASGRVAEAIFAQIGLGDSALTAWSIAKWPVLALAVTGLVAALYSRAPNVEQPGLRWLTPGAGLALGVWALASLGFAFYVSNFGSFNETYGTLAGVIIFLMWLWISNIALLFGAEFDAELQRQRQIEGGMRPHDREPFLPYREAPDE